MLITEDKVSGWITCGKDRVADGACEGYTSELTELIVQTVTRTFGDAHGDTSDPFYSVPSTSHEYLRLASGEEPTCAHCGAPASLSLAPRDEYRRLSAKGPEDIVREAEMERARHAREIELVSAGERQAAALEQLARAAPLVAETDRLRELVERQSAQIERLVAQLEPTNGEPPEAAPKPRRKPA